MLTQLPLFSHALPALKPGDVVLVRAAGYIGVIAQIWPGRDYYVVFSMRRPMSEPSPTYRRDELDLLPDAYRSEAWETNGYGYMLPGSPERIAEEQRRAAVVEAARGEVRQ